MPWRKNSCPVARKSAGNLRLHLPSTSFEVKELAARIAVEVVVTLLSGYFVASRFSR
jgi:hypothetical protein